MPRMRAATKFPTRQTQDRRAVGAGPHGIALAPPAYGLDVVDRAAAGEGPLQLRPAPVHAPVQPQAPATHPNRTGLPDHLKAGIESLSGLSLDDVRVHYQSAKPARLQALAYTQGTDIHTGVGQEKHLAHEVWHVVQQKQGRVRPTLQMKDGVAINDDAGLEKEADVMGAKALQMGRSDRIATDSAAHTATAVQRAGETRDASEVTGAAIRSPEEKVRVHFPSTQQATAPADKDAVQPSRDAQTPSCKQGNDLAGQQRSQPTIQRVKKTADVNATKDSFMRNLQYVSGHGTLCKNALKQKGLPEEIRVPSYTTITFWLPHGAAFNDWAGQQVEAGGNFANLIELYKDEALALEVYENYEKVPNYTLTPGKDLTMVQQPGAKSFIADRTYTLADLMTKFKGKNIHWAACRSESNTMTADELWGTAKGNRENREELTYAKKTLWSAHKNQEHFHEQMSTMRATIIGDVKRRGQKVGADLKSMSVEEMKEMIKETLALSPSKPNVFEAFGAYSQEYTPGGENKVKSEYKAGQEKIDNIEREFQALNEIASANNTTPDGWIQRSRDTLAQKRNQMQIEEQKQGDERDEDTIANLDDEIFDSESEIRAYEAVISGHQNIERYKREDRIKKAKYIKTRVHDLAWQTGWQ